MAGSLRKFSAGTDREDCRSGMMSPDRRNVTPNCSTRSKIAYIVPASLSPPATTTGRLPKRKVFRTKPSFFRSEKPVQSGVDCLLHQPILIRAADQDPGLVLRIGGNSIFGNNGYLRTRKSAEISLQFLAPPMLWIHRET